LGVSFHERSPPTFRILFRFRAPASGPCGPFAALAATAFAGGIGCVPFVRAPFAGGPGRPPSCSGPGRQSVPPAAPVVPRPAAAQVAVPFVRCHPSSTPPAAAAAAAPLSLLAPPARAGRARPSFPGTLTGRRRSGGRPTAPASLRMSGRLPPAAPPGAAPRVRRPDLPGARSDGGARASDLFRQLPSSTIPQEPKGVFNAN
jgi:hypothetical protein